MDAKSSSFSSFAGNDERTLYTTLHVPWYFTLLVKRSVIAQVPVYLNACTVERRYTEKHYFTLPEHVGTPVETGHCAVKMRK